jgi:hypothetical protein
MARAPRAAAKAAVKVEVEVGYGDAISAASGGRSGPAGGAHVPAVPPRGSPAPTCRRRATRRTRRGGLRVGDDASWQRPSKRATSGRISALSVGRAEPRDPRPAPTLPIRKRRGIVVFGIGAVHRHVLVGTAEEATVQLRHLMAARARVQAVHILGGKREVSDARRARRRRCAYHPQTSFGSRFQARGVANAAIVNWLQGWCRARGGRDAALRGAARSPDTPRDYCPMSSQANRLLG